MKLLGLHIMLAATLQRALEDARVGGWIAGAVKASRVYRGEDLDEAWQAVAATLAEPAPLRLIAVDGQRRDSGVTNPDQGGRP